MTTVFLSGSRKLGRLTDEIRRRIDNMVEKQLDIVTGDANGADKAMQAYLAECGYSRVTIFHVGDAPRNNVGNWPTKHVSTDEKLSGRDFYAQKDKEMSKIADFGFVLWDGKSPGSVQNMFWLSQEGKKLVVYFSPQKRFYSFGAQDDLLSFLSQCDAETLSEIGKKITLPDRLRAIHQSQASFVL
jgi:hypothetical protein